MNRPGPDWISENDGKERGEKRKMIQVLELEGGTYLLFSSVSSRFLTVS